MSVEIKVPQLPESVSDATIATWHKQPGDAVKRDENLVDLETDKVVLEVPAPADGVLESHAVGEGDTVTSDDVLGVLKEGKAASKPDSSDEKASDDADDSSDDDGESLPLSPAVKRLVDENDLDPSKIEGTGKGGRLVKGDVLAYMEKQGDDAKAEKAAPTKGGPAKESAAKATQEKAVQPAPQFDNTPSGERVEQRVPMTRLRKRIAERLLDATQTTAMLTTFNEVNMQPVMDLRAKYKDQFAKEHDVKLGFMSFFVKAAVEGLKRFPAVNASIDGDDILYHGYFDIGMAVSSPRGLVVPILRDCDAMSFADVERTISGLGVKARDGQLSMDDLTGGTFSITNGGIFGSLNSTPILNPPQSAILGMHSIKERPIAENGQVVIRPMMNLAVSYDHRIIDGREAVQFLVTIKECIEDPARLLLQI